MTDGSLAKDLSSVLGLRDCSIDEALRHLDSRLGREGSESHSRLRVLSDSGWALQGGETATRVFTVAGTASDRVTLILKTCVSSAMGSSASTMEAWLSRRRLIDEAGVATPSLYAVSGGTILEDFIDHNLWTFLRDRPDKECESVVKSLARLSLGLDDLGFINDMTQILSEMAPTRQSLFFSATMDRRVSSLINKFANTPIEISVKSSETSENVHQNVVQYKDYRHKIEQLHDILTGDNLDKVIIFDETQRSVERLSKELLGRGFKADAIHGGKNQGQRQRALMKFKQSDINILVATDVAARGIDVADISHVINYSTPQTYDDYVHRIGRAGRAGKIGHALTFIES